jgi:serine phosphatase RsbU (regulator of sigma subunit)/PAS domain-containing protein
VGRGRWIGLSLALATTLAALDVALGAPVLMTALVAPPLLAAARVGPRQTALVGLYSVALAVLLGVPDGSLGTPAHGVRAGVVAVATLLAVWVAGLGQRLSQSRDQLRAILEGVADAVVARDASGRSVFANRAALDLLRFETEEDLIAFPAEPVTERLEVLTEDGRPLAAPELPGRRAARGEALPPATVRLRTRDTGEERWAVVKATPIRAGAGGPALSIVLVEDVTEVKRHERRERLLSEAGRLLGASLGYRESVRALGEVLVPDLADWFLVDVVDERGAVRPAATAAADPGARETLRRLREERPPDQAASLGAAEAIRAGVPALHRDVGAQTLAAWAAGADLDALRDLGPRSAIVVPMLRRARAVGALTLVAAESGRSFDDHDLALAGELAERIATAVDNARLYAERSRIARALQESLLPPSLPEPPGIEAAARFRAAGAGSEVGGDFYDLFQSGTGRWSVVMGDVCGKGADAAAITALARYTLRTAAMTASRPSDVLGTLNRAMLRQSRDEQFCTVAFATLRPHGPAASVTVASGGHPLPLLLRADGEVVRVGTPGTLLGVVEDPELDDEEVRLAPGDCLVFYTDGVTEANAPEQIVAPAELTAALRACAGLDAATITERLERLTEAPGREPRDDVAILALRLRERDGGDGGAGGVSP